MGLSMLVPLLVLCSLFFIQTTADYPGSTDLSETSDGGGVIEDHEGDYWDYGDYGDDSWENYFDYYGSYVDWRYTYFPTAFGFIIFFKIALISIGMSGSACSGGCGAHSCCYNGRSNGASCWGWVNLLFGILNFLNDFIMFILLIMYDGFFAYWVMWFAGLFTTFFHLWQWRALKVLATAPPPLTFQGASMNGMNRVMSVSHAGGLNRGMSVSHAGMNRTMSVSHAGPGGQNQWPQMPPVAVPPHYCASCGGPFMLPSPPPPMVVCPYCHVHVALNGQGQQSAPQLLQAIPQNYPTQPGQNPTQPGVVQSQPAAQPVVQPAAVQNQNVKSDFAIAPPTLENQTSDFAPAPLVARSASFTPAPAQSTFAQSEFEGKSQTPQDNIHMAQYAAE